MDTLTAWGYGLANQGKEQRVFDWEKAAHLIASKPYLEWIAGLKEDMEWTSDIIWEEECPVLDASAYLASTWATPILCTIDGEDIECWKMQSEIPEWGADTMWPESALKIVGERLQ